jgi:hypothetical protein
MYARGWVGYMCAGGLVVGGWWRLVLDSGPFFFFPITLQRNSEWFACARVG